MKVVDGGEIHTVPKGWGVFCHKCRELIKPETQCFIEDTAWRNIYHMWCKPEKAKAEPAPTPQRTRVPKRRMVAEGSPM